MQAPQVPLPGPPEEKTFVERLESLLAVDCYRVSRILETAQYALLYGILCLPVGLAIDWLCNKLYPVPSVVSVESSGSDKKREVKRYNGKSLWLAIGVALLQVALSAVSIIYIRKLADLVPFLFNVCPSRYVAHYHVDEVSGESAIALVFVGVQVSLLRQLEIIRESLVGGSE